LVQNHGQSFLSNCDTAMQKKQRRQEKCWIPSIKTHTQKTIIITRVRYLSLLETTVIDLGKKRKNKNKISFKTIQKDNKERKKTTEFCHSI